mmetsp:Transcript_31318/g.82987  ORF Transcript_31318/g.82987 Transcript_31318/m.82987 type:complete len:279 (-) Transcript_31318:197-1033(-)
MALPSAALRQRRGSAARYTGLALLAATLWLACSTRGPAFADGGAGAALGHLDEALAQITSLQAQVEAGQVVPNFGSKAQEIVTKACSNAGSAAPELEQAIDGALQGLFLRQAALLREEVAKSFGSKAEIDAPAQADKQFLAAARDLVRPGSGWSLEHERGQLRASMEDNLRRGAALLEERARAAQVQQSTVEVISKLQEQMEHLAAKVQSARGGGSPWVLSTSYRIPNTPFQVVGRYEQGRANVELNLTPDKSPLNTQASFVEGIGPANIGVSFNLGL